MARVVNAIFHWAILFMHVSMQPLRLFFLCCSSLLDLGVNDEDDNEDDDNDEDGDTDTDADFGSLGENLSGGFASLSSLSSFARFVAVLFGAFSGLEEGCVFVLKKR